MGQYIAAVTLIEKPTDMELRSTATLGQFVKNAAVLRQPRQLLVQRMMQISRFRAGAIDQV